MENINEIEILDDMLKNASDWAGPTLKSYLKAKAEKLIIDDKKQLELIHCLVESHVPGLRRKLVLMRDKDIEKKDIFGDDMKTMLNMIEEMPKEWTLVQLTSRFNSKEYFISDHNELLTNGLHIVVFKCGPKASEPFSVIVSPPIDKISKSPIELRKHMHNFISDTKDLYYDPSKSKRKKLESNLELKAAYKEKKEKLNSQLEELLRNMMNLWLREFKCLLTGTYEDQNVENKILKKLISFMDQENVTLSQKVLNILLSAIKAGDYMSNTDLIKIVKYCVPENLPVQRKLLSLIDNFLVVNSIPKNCKMNPLILILDDDLECFPWESMDILSNQSISRLPSLHFAYILFKVYQDSIKNGFHMVENYKNGKYIINPDLDLKSMEARLKEFFKYWLPEWSGVIGEKPEKNIFKDLLTSADIFEYSGHGSGNRHLSLGQISKTSIKAPVFLFGCSSAGTISDGPQLESYGHYQNYLIAYCPCLIGMLWIVTDDQTDILTAEFLSTWVPSSAELHWKYINKNEWIQKGKVIPVDPMPEKCKDIRYEPEMIRALNIAKKKSKCSFPIKAACVARGIPIKMAEVGGT